MLLVQNKKSTQSERHTIFPNSQSTQEGEIIPADSEPMRQRPQVENQHLEDISQAQVDDDSLSRQEKSHQEEQRGTRAEVHAQLSKLAPVDAACWGGRLMMLVSKIGHQPLENLFQTNLLDKINSYEELNDAQREVLLNADDFSKSEKKQISEIFFWPMFKSGIAARNDLAVMARDFADNFRFKRLPATKVFMEQMEKLGPDNFLKLHNVMLNDQLTNQLELEKLRIEVNRRIVSGGAVSYSKGEVVKTLGKLFKKSEALPVCDPDCIKSRLDWEKMISVKVLLTFFANYLEHNLSDFVGEEAVDKKISHIVESLSAVLIKDAMFFDLASGNSEGTGCLASIYLHEIVSHVPSDYINPLSLIGIFEQRAEKVNCTMAAYGTKLERLAALTDEETKSAIAAQIDEKKNQLIDEREQIRTVHDQLKSLTNRVGSLTAAYVLNIKPEEGTIDNISFDSIKKHADLAVRLGDLFENDALADTSKVVSVLAELDNIPSIRFLNMVVSSVDGGPYRLPSDEGQNSFRNINSELVALFERLQSNFQEDLAGSSDSKRSMAQNVLSVLAKKCKFDTVNAFFKYLNAEYWKPVEGVVQRYMTDVSDCYLQRTMIESLVKQQLHKVDASAQALWGLNHSINANYEITAADLHVASKLKRARENAENNFKGELVASIRRKIESSKNTVTVTQPDRNLLEFLNAIIKFESDDAEQTGINLETFHKIRKDINYQYVCAEYENEEENWEKFSDFYKACTSLAESVVSARTNNDMPWGPRMALLGTEADLKKLNEMCDGLGEHDLTDIGAEDRKFCRDHRITEIMNMLVGGHYNFKFSNDEEVRTSLRRLMMVINDPGAQPENTSFESNALEQRLASAVPDVPKSSTYRESPDILRQQLASLAEVQDFIFWQLPDLLNGPLTDSARLYSDILVPLERFTQGLLPLPECPIVKQVHREIVGLLNYALKTHSQALSPIAMSILSRSQARERPNGEQIFSKIIDNTNSLVEQLREPADFGTPDALETSAAALIKVVLPLMYDERVENSIVQTALEMLNHERLASTLPSMVRQIENEYELLQQANAFIALVEEFTSFKAGTRTDIDGMLRYSLSLKDLPEGTAPWLKSAVSQKIEQARSLMQPPEDVESVAIWTDRVDSLREKLKLANLDVLEIVAPEVQAAGGVNSRYLYQDDDISLLIQKAIEESEGGADTESADGLVQRPTGAQTLTLAPSAVGTLETLKDRVEEWLDIAGCREEPSVHILPYNPATADGSNSLHWTAIILHLSDENALTVSYMNPLHQDSPIPLELRLDMAGIVSEYDELQGTSFAKQIHFVPILHSSQDDATSCGPRIVADCTQIIEHWCKNGVLLRKLPAIEDVNALRLSHLEALGGLDSEFGQRQLWNLIYSDGADLNVRDIRAQDRLKEALLDDLVALYSEDANMFEVIKENPNESTWQELANNSGIKPLNNVNSILTLDQLIKGAVKTAEKVLAMHASVETLYETDLEIILDLIALQQEVEKTEHSNEQLAEHLRDIMSAYIEGVRHAPTREMFSNTDTPDRVISGFYPTFKGINVDPKVSDLPGEIDAFRKVLPSIDFAKSGYLEKILEAHVKADESDSVGTFKLIRALKQALKRVPDTAKVKDHKKSGSPNYTACWQLIQGQIDMPGDSELLGALYPEALRKKYEKALDIPRLYGDVLREALAKINLRSSARVGEIAKAFQNLRKVDGTSYQQILDKGEVGLVINLQKEYLSVRKALVEQEAIVASLQALEVQEVQEVQDVQGGGASVGRENSLAAAQEQRDTLVARKAKLLPLLEKVIVNFDDTASDEDVRALQFVPWEMLEMAASQVRFESKRRQPQSTAYGSWFDVIRRRAF